MLVLSREEGQKIIIGDNEIVVMVVGVRGGKVKIGIQAPKGVAVNREEVFLRMQKESSNAKAD